MQYDTQLNSLFEDFKRVNHAKMNAISSDTKPKDFIKTISEDILERYGNKPLIGQYDIYQHLLDYWNESLKDDVYLIVEDGWVAKVKRILEKNKKGTEIDKGWTCDLIPKELVINRFLASEYQELVSIETELESIQAEIASFEEEHAGDEGILTDATNDKGSITKTTLTAFIKDIKSNPEDKDTLTIANELLELINREAQLKKDQKEKVAELDALTLKTYNKLTEDDVRILVVEDKWLTSINASIQTEIDAISQRLTTRVKQLAERYENTLLELDKETKTLEDKVSAHLQKMGLAWS
jgi:type I restriction enzyme M protein